MINWLIYGEHKNQALTKNNEDSIKQIIEARPYFIETYCMVLLYNFKQVKSLYRKGNLCRVIYFKGIYFNIVKLLYDLFSIYFL